MSSGASASKQLKQVKSLSILRWIERNCDSYNRLEALLTAQPYFDRDCFFKALGVLWCCSDDIWKHKDRLSQILINATRQELDLMMEPDELLELSKLPDTLKIYRGCYEHNRDGLSWTTDKAIAKSFPTLQRYSHPNEDPMLMEDSINIGRTVLKLDRNEWEIIKCW